MVRRISLLKFSRLAMGLLISWATEATNLPMEMSLSSWTR